MNSRLGRIALVFALFATAAHAGDPGGPARAKSAPGADGGSPQADANAPPEPGAPPGGSQSDANAPTPEPGAQAEAPPAAVVSSQPTAPVAPAAPSPPEAEGTSTSLIGGRALGHFRVGAQATIGFPLIELKLGVGLSDRFDVSVGYSTFYFLSHELQGQLRLELFAVSGFRMMLSLLGSGAFFAQAPFDEVRGSRWLTGRRNFNVSPGLLASWQGSTPRAVRLSLELRYWLAISTQGEALLGHNVMVRGTAELPLSNRVAFVFSLGFDVHGRPEDSVLMPVAMLGISVNF